MEKKYCIDEDEQRQIVHNYAVTVIWEWLRLSYSCFHENKSSYVEWYWHSLRITITEAF